LFFSAWVFVMGVFTVFLIPETKNVPIEDMAEKVWKQHWFWKRYMYWIEYIKGIYICMELEACYKIMQCYSYKNVSYFSIFSPFPCTSFIFYTLSWYIELWNKISLLTTFLHICYILFDVLYVKILKKSML
jgi:hypothetical protein